MQKQDFEIRDLKGDDAAIAWKAYLANRGAGFGKGKDRLRAEALDTPEVVVLLGICPVMTHGLKPLKNFAREDAVAIAAMRRSGAACVDLLFVHTRHKGDGIGGELMRVVMSRLPVGMTLAAQSAACTSWTSTLFYVSLGFFVDEEAKTAEFPLPWDEGTGPRSHGVSFTWTKSAEPHNERAAHLEHVKQVAASQSARRTLRGKAFGKALSGVLEKLTKAVDGVAETEEEVYARRSRRDEEMETVRLAWKAEKAEKAGKAAAKAVGKAAGKAVAKAATKTPTKAAPETPNPHSTRSKGALLHSRVQMKAPAKMRASARK